jgi:parallel beta-helix repeat protein/predicted outer membrane repeat protein
MQSRFRRPRRPALARPPARARLAVESLEDRAVPTIFTVTTLNDSVSGSLRDAITSANNNPGPDAVVFAPGLSGTITLKDGELLINDSLTITGRSDPRTGALTISGDDKSRIFEIAPDIDVAIGGLTLTKGNASDGGAIKTDENGVPHFNNLVLSGVVITDNKATGNGGGISAPKASHLTLQNCTVSGNQTTGIALGGGIYIDRQGLLVLENSTVNNNRALEGGGLFVSDPDQGTLVRNSTISGNSSVGGPGGGLFINASLTIENCTISDNSAVGGGGGIRAGGSQPLIIKNTTISGNRTTSQVTPNGNGGGILAVGDPLSSITIESCTISGNSADANGGGIFASGGGILPSGSTLTVENSTISGNSAGGNGGGISFTDDTTVVRNSTIAFNTADADNAGGGLGGGLFVEFNAAVALQSTLVGDNAVGAAGANPDVSGAVKATFSLVGNAAGTTFLLPGSAANLTGVDPLLGPLADNGGPTKTHALLPGSPAINHGANAAGLASDQRGSRFLRVFGRGVDIGAFELIMDAPVPPAAQSLQAAVRAIQSLQPSGARLAAAAFADLSGDFVNDIVVALKLKNGKLLVVSFDGFNGHILNAFVPFPAKFQAGARVQLLTADLNGDGSPEVVLLVSGGGPGVPRLSAFTPAGRRVL